jgi:hypothetical protein
MSLFSIILLAVFVFIAWKVSPRESKDDAHVHGAGQVGLLAAVALFGVDYFTSYFYATGEMMSALHPYNLQRYAYVAVAVIAFANFAFGALYMYAIGIFKEGGGAYSASMRYLWPSLSLLVIVTLLQDYILTIVVSALSGSDQFLSILSAYDAAWYWHFLIAAGLASITWFVTIRGRGESAQVVFMMLALFVLMTTTMAVGLFIAYSKGIPAVPAEAPVQAASLGSALMHMLTASMKGMVALTGLEAMADGIQFVIDEDGGFVKWGKKRLPRLRHLWNFYSGKVGIGRFVQTSFLFYGGIGTLFLTFFAIHFNVFDGTAGKTLVGNLANIGFNQIPGGFLMYWVYQGLAVALLAAASMTAFQDLQATAWRNVAIGEVPEYIVHRDARGTFTRSVHISFVVAVLIMLLVRGKTSVAVPFYGVGVFMPIMVMSLAVRQHIKQHYTGTARARGVAAATFAALLAATIFVGQIVGKWEEGGWIVLISFSLLALLAHIVLISPAGYRDPRQIHRIVRDKARAEGAMATIVEWQALRTQEYRHGVLSAVVRFLGIMGVQRPLRYDPQPAVAGEYDVAVRTDLPEVPSVLEEYLKDEPGASASQPKGPAEAGRTS